MGAAARPVRTKRPSRRAAEAAAAGGGQILASTRRAAASTKKLLPGRGANASTTHQIQVVPADVVGMAEAAAAARSASRNLRAKRRRPTPSSPRAKKKKLLRSRPLTLDPCSNHRGARISSTTDGDLRCPPPPPPPDDDDAWRDWANLADGPAGLIADRVLGYDVADYVRFRAVCRPWRHCCTDPRSHGGLDRRFHPSRWTMLREELAAPDRRCFLNTSTGECLKVHIPELNDYKLLALTPEGLLVLVRDRQHIRLLNPLTRHLTHLPPLTTLVPPDKHKNLLEDHIYFDGRFTAWGSGIATDASTSTVVLCFDRLGMIGLAKPGDDSWKLLRYRRDGMTVAPLMFQGRFYSMNHSGVMVLETGGAGQPPQLRVAAKLSMRVSAFADSVHLVNNGGELLMVHRRSSPMTARNKSRRCYDTYRVDLDTETLVPVKSLGGSGGAGRAVFMGLYCSLSVPLDVFPSGSIAADTIYLSFDIRERIILTAGAYHLSDGRVERPCRLVPRRPHTLVDCLSLANAVTEC